MHDHCHSLYGYMTTVKWICKLKFQIKEEPSWSWSYGSWIYNNLCNQCLLPLKLWVWIPFRWGVLDTTLCNKVCQWLATGRWFSPVSSTNRTYRHDITEILLKVALNTINQPSNKRHIQIFLFYFYSLQMLITCYDLRQSRACYIYIVQLEIVYTKTGDGKYSRLSWSIQK